MAAAAQEQGKTKEIRLVCAAPSPYTRRRDSYRAGAGILLCLRRLIEEKKLPLKATYYDPSGDLGNAAKVRAVVLGAQVLLVGTSVWAQGPSSVSRQFFEAVNTDSLAGVAASTWVTSGGAHTGAALAFDTNLSSLRGMGAAVFSFGQKQMVFTTDERLDVADGDFTLMDVWFMEGLAKASIVWALAAGDAAEAERVWRKLDGSAIYYRANPPRTAAEIKPRFGEILELINAAKPPNSEARRKIDALVTK